MYTLYYLIKLLEDMQEDEQAVLLILRTFVVPTILALHPENTAFDPVQMLTTLRELNPLAYQYRIGQIVNKFSYSNNQIAQVGN